MATEGAPHLQPSSAPRPRCDFTLLVVALCAGITIGWNQPGPVVWPWLIACAGLLILAWFCLNRPRPLTLALMAAMLALGAAWVTLHHRYTSLGDLAAWMGEERVPIRVTGVATGPPILRSRTAGSMARFDYREPGTYCPMRIEALLPRGSSPLPMRGTVLVRVDETVPPFRAGDHITALGFLSQPAVPRNPGEFNFRQYARSLGQAGVLAVPQRELLHIEPASRSNLINAFLNWRHQLQLRAGAWLLSDLPESAQGERQALLTNLLLGEREAQIDGLYGAFQRVGLAHILAISGFHLAVLAGFVLLGLRMVFGVRRWHGLAIIAVVVLYLLLVELRMPVLRAGVMTIAASIGLIFARRLHVGGLVALSAIGLLLWRPDQLFNPGFQLSYGVVLGLIHIAPIVRRRWFGDPDMLAPNTAAMVGQWLRTSVAVAVTAWLIATPIAVHHFGMISPLGAPMSVIIVPTAAVVLALGYAKMVLSSVLPSVALLVGVPLSIGADVMVAIVTAIDRLPLSVMHVPFASVTWTLAALVWTCWWGLESNLRRRRWLWPALTALIIWLLWPWIPLHAKPPLRIDMLAVGDGTCIVARSGPSAVLFDCGSSTDLDAGRRSIVPAMRRLGVRRVDAIIISHANLDHYSAAIEVAREFNVPEVLFTPQFLSNAQRDPLGPAAHLTATLTQRRTALREMSAGASRRFGESTWTWLHPPADRDFDRVNDASMVIQVEAAGRRVLLCGDIQRQAMMELMKSDAALKADIIELPHHGSYHDAAEQFIALVNPQIVMQSTGFARLVLDRWAQPLSDRTRLVTARDGACTIVIDADGGIATTTFLPHAATIAHPSLPGDEPSH